VLPYDRPQDPDAPGLARLERLLAERAGRPDAPAAVVVETIQGEGGMYTATADWLRRLASICLSHDTLLIVDDVQMGCGRTGPFFSFEHSGIHPDIVCVSKSLSGYGLPMALTLLRPELDVWAPGEHTGTFRGSGPALATAIAAIDLWRSEDLEQQTLTKGKVVEHALRGLAADYGDAVTEIRGRGLAWGLAFREPGLAQAVCARAFERGLIVETSGRTDDVVKLLPPLIAAEEDLTGGLDLLRDAVAAAVPGQAT
jgi:diaminobutyrate-2-oxoglutarate transaminase